MLHRFSLARLAAALLPAALLGCSQGQREPTDAPVGTGEAPADWRLVNFAKLDSVNPLLGPSPAGVFTDPILRQPVRWEAKDVYNPAAVVRGGKLYLLYRAENNVSAGVPKTSRLGLAVSTDGVHFRRQPAPVLYPARDEQQRYEWPGGTEDPRVVEDEAGRYILTYTAYDGKLARLMVATSPDLVRWTKHGPAFAQAYGGKYVNKWTKSGAIVARYLADGRIVATKVNGSYWMYFGDAQVWVASSPDLIHWTPVEMAAGEQPPVPLRAQARTMPRLKVALPTREGKFDSDLVESGPPAMLTEQGIRLIYNSRNVPAIGDKSLPEGTYTAAQALFDKNDPTRLVKRMDKYFIRPERPYETTGQVNQVVFLEGLVRYHDYWHLYYGTADSKIAVATAPIR